MVATVASLNSEKVKYYVKSYYLNGQAEGECLDTRGAQFLGVSGQ